MFKNRNHEAHEEIVKKSGIRIYNLLPSPQRGEGDL
jgi:hypothetical protein